MRLVAASILLMERVATRLGIQVGRGKFQSEVAAHDMNTPALANARREVFGDDGSHIL